MRYTPRSLATSVAVLCLALLANASDPAGTDPAQRYRAITGAAQKLLVYDGARAAALSAGGATLVADYGSFQVFDANDAALADLAGPGVEHANYANRIELHAGVVDTRAEDVRAARQVARRATDFSGKRLHLVQFAGPVKPEWFAELAKTRVEIVDYIPHNAYLVYGTGAAIASLQQFARGLSAVQFEGAYLDSDKIHPRVKALAGKHAALGAVDGLYQVQLVADASANADTLALLESVKLGGEVRANAVARYVNAIARLPGSVIEGLASRPDVLSIRPYVTPRKFDERQNQIIAGNLSGNNPSGPGYLDWLASKGFSQAQFDASAFVVDVTDSGVDNANTNAPNHFALRRTGNLSLASRLAYARLEGSANSGSTIQGCDGHGTINAHIIGGYVTMTNSPHTDATGYRYGLGVAPFVKVGSSVIFDPADFTNPDYEDLISRAYRDGARISSDSWGADTAGDYDADAQAYDYLVRDAQPSGAAVSTAGNQQMTICFAAGNAGSGAQTVGSPGTAKNVITVGAAENVHPFGAADGCSTPDSEANSANDMATFSSRGPCSDQRRKPEIVAPGTHISGGVAQSAASTNGTGSALACFAGEGVCGGAGTNIFFPTGQKFYTASSGTSHSTPALAGGAALVYQWFINQFSAPPSPAMVKAFLMNAARYMNGTGANDSLWSNSQGMGMMNLGTAFDGTQRLLRDQLTNDLFTASGQTRTFTGVVVSNSKPVRVSLSWTDAPGATSGNAYKNNLNLSVVVNGQTYLGNVFSGQYSATGGSADLRNNSESVFLPAGTTGSVVITVSAANINSDGVPNFGGSLDQDFALVAYNFTEVQVPVIASAGYQITAESCGMGNGAVDPDEVVTVAFALQNAGSADTTNVMATLLATGGVSSPNGPLSYGALPAGGAAVTNAFTFTATGACGGTVTATLALQDGATDLGSIVYTFPIGGATAVTSTFANVSTITINDNASASPYPSTINVSGLAGSISKVVVEVLGFSHTYPEDVDVVLVGPGGQKVALMGAVGGGTDASGANLTFDDAASGQIATVTTGTYQPSGSVAEMPSPAPAASYGSALADFIDAAGNGTWSLYVVDAAAEDSGSIAQGWRLRITAGEPLCCASNQPPVLAAIGNQAVAQSNTLTFVVSAVDPYDGDPITLSASNLPAGAVFDTVTNAPSVTNTFLWTNALPLGVYTTTFYAVDKDGVDLETVLISVTEAGGATNYIVDFEGAGETKEAFASGTVTLSGKDWNLTDALIGTLANDRKNGLRAARVRNSGTLTMLADITGGVGVVSFAYGSYGTDSATALALDYSTDGGSVWANAGTVTVSSSTLETYSTNISQNGDVRLRIRKTSGGSQRANVDDIMTTSFGGAAPQSPPALAAIGPKNVVVSNLLQFAVSASPTDGDAVTLTASNLPSGATFDATNEFGTFVWTSAAPVGVYTTSFYAADDDGVDSEDVVISVGEQAPVSTNHAALYLFEDNALAFTRAADSVAPGFSASLFDSADGSTTNLGGNPEWAISDTGFTGSHYFHFTLTADGGATVSLTRLKFDTRRSNTGPSTWSVRSSVDDYAADLAGGSSSTTFATNEVTLSLVATGSVTFRVYGQSGTAGGTWRLDNVTVFGSVAGGGDSGDLPGIVITTAPQVVSNPTTSISVGGTANTNTIGELTWTNALTGGTGTLPAATNWLIASVSLDVGSNPITVRGTNAGGSSASASVTIVRQSAGGGGGTSTTFFVETIGNTGTSGDSIAVHESNNRFDNDDLTMSGTGDIRSTSASSGYTGASGANNAMLNAIGEYFQIAGMDTLGSTNMTLTFGVRKSTIAENGSGLVVESSADGSSWTQVSPAGAWLPTGSGTATWHFRTNAIPDSLASTGMLIRFRSTNAVEWRVDDITLTGYAAGGGPPDISPILVITTAPQTVAVEVSGIAVGGTSSNLAGVISWTNDLSGGAGTIPAATDWLIDPVGLAVGTNTITVSGSNSIGIATGAVVLIVRESADTDGDGIEDAWEQAYFGSLTNVNDTSDWDLDGFPDLHEFLAGSIPTNGASLLKATMTSNAPAGGVVVQWQSESNRQYILSRSEDLLSGFVGFVSNISADPPLNTYTDAAPTNALLIYRIELQPEP